MESKTLKTAVTIAQELGKPFAEIDAVIARLGIPHVMYVNAPLYDQDGIERIAAGLKTGEEKENHG